MSTVTDLIAEIEAFCREEGIAEATFGTRAARDGKFVRRLREGAGVTVRTVDSVRSYIAAEREKRTIPPKPGAARKARAA